MNPKKRNNQNNDPAKIKKTEKLLNTSKICYKKIENNNSSRALEISLPKLIPQYIR